MGWDGVGGVGCDSVGVELSDSRWFVYTCYECTVFAPIVI